MAAHPSPRFPPRLPRLHAPHLHSQLEQLGIPTSTSPFDFDALGRLYLFLTVEAVVFALLTLAIQVFSSSAGLRMRAEAIQARLQGEPPDALGLASSLGPSPLEDEMVRYLVITLSRPSRTRWYLPTKYLP